MNAGEVWHVRLNRRANVLATVEIVEVTKHTVVLRDHQPNWPWQRDGHRYVTADVEFVERASKESP